jgi:hypothetical protein
VRGIRRRPFSIAGRGTPAGLARAACCAALLLAACGAQPAAVPGAPTPARPGSGPASAAPSAATVPATPDDSGWLAGVHGTELRRLRVARGAGRPPAPLLAARIDPAAVRLRVAYAPERPRPLLAWAREHQPLLAINGGYFGPDYHATALVISDGVARGDSYEGFGGMLAVTSGGAVSLRPLRDQPYDPGEPLAQGMQSSPMLVLPGGVAASIHDDGERARRSALAQDRVGRLLLIVSPTAAFTLSEFAAWLAASDMEIDRAVNLDGGSSTGLFVSDGPLQEAIDSFGPLPLVLLVEPRG